ncbi:hypothetical protein BBJ28_00000599 [Nothophytophthora sp. Chile5]|nr:hypothetical protein BBJ28_00000599 [Nothophytophthora sp. Chile5]
MASLSDASTSNDAGDPAAAPTRRKFSHTTAVQRQCLLEWLEQPGNFQLLTRPISAQALEGGASSSSPAKRRKKTDGYRSLAQHMNRMTHTQWTDKTARSRFESFMAAYRKALRQNPHHLPPFFERVDALFAPRSSANVNRNRPETNASSPSKAIKAHEQAAVVPVAIVSAATRNQELQPRRTEPKRAVVSAVVSAVPLAATVSSSFAGETSPLQALTTVPDELKEQFLRLESERLAVRQQELELKRSELLVRQEEGRQKLRADMLMRLVEAGKSATEVAEFLALMNHETS